MRIMSELHAKSVERKAASVNIIKPASARCTIRACPFPSYAGGKCRQHIADARAEYSMTPSTTADAISGLGRLFA
jgi:hypothetical protein